MVPPTGKTQQSLKSVTKEIKGYKTALALLRKLVPTYTSAKTHTHTHPLPCLATHELTKRASTDTPQFCLKLSNLPEVDATEL